MASPTATPAPPPPSAAQEALLRQVFSAMDADGDGQVSLHEFLEAAKSRSEAEMELPAMHAFYDANGDGVLTIEEWTKGIAATGRTDEEIEEEMNDVLQVGAPLEGGCETWPCGYCLSL